MLDGVVWTERDISAQSPIWSVGMGRLMTGASVDCLPSAGRLLVFCSSCAVVVVARSGVWWHGADRIRNLHAISDSVRGFSRFHKSTSRRPLRGLRRSPEFQCPRCHAGGPIRCARLSRGNKWDQNRNQSPILALVLSFGAGLQSGNESSH